MEVRENGKFQQIFGPIPNIPNYLECFYGTQVLSISIENVYSYIFKIDQKLKKLLAFL